MPSLKPRPDCEGPKLEPFTYDITAHDVEFLEFPPPTGVHGIIAKVKIDGQIYCLKLFFEEGPMAGFLTYQEPKDTFPTLEKVQLDHNNPFHCECRAFGRLKQLGREDLAVRVYGYISLPLTKDILKKIYCIMESNTEWVGYCGIANGVPMPLNIWHVFRKPEGPDDGSCCIMGIVKDWVDDPADKVQTHRYEGMAIPRQSSTFRHLLANLKALHRCGIAVCDVKLDMWIGSTLVDLSCAMTIPHMYGPEGESQRPSWIFASAAAWDLRCFQTNVIDWWNSLHLQWSALGAGVTCPRKCRLRVCGVQEPLGMECMRRPHEVLLAEQAKRMRERLRPRRPRQYGPFLPILNLEGFRLDLTELPPYDPAKFDWRAAEAAGGKQRKSGPTASLKTGLSGRRGGKVNKQSAGLKRKA